MPDEEEIANAFEANKLTCSVCGYLASEPKVLGSHKRFKHGIAGTSNTARLRNQHIEESKRRKSARSGNGSIIEVVLGYLDAYRGAHHFSEIAETLGLEEGQVKNAISKARISGHPLGSDGNGNWQYLSSNLKVVASDRPRTTTVSKELVPTATTNGHKPPRVFRPVELGDDLELLETESDDGTSSLWLATRIK